MDDEELEFKRYCFRQDAMFYYNYVRTITEFVSYLSELKWVQVPQAVYYYGKRIN